MDWLVIGMFMVQVIIMPIVWHVFKKLDKIKANDIHHLEEDIKAIKDDVKTLTEKFINHLENHG